MTEELRETYAEFEAIAHEAQTLTFGARALELQEAARKKIEAFSERLASQKAAAVERGQERVANELLLLCALATVLHSELSMWISLKCDRGEDAWSYFVEAQRLCESTIRLRRALFGGESVKQLENLAEKYDLIELLVFPPQVFCSVGGVAHEAKCSICDGNYDACGHIAGRAYMGEFCARIITKWEVHEVSIVPDPANKLCRATHFTDGGRQRNRMTWRLEGPSKEAEPRPDASP